VKQGIIVPVYRHGRTACPIAERLAATGLPVILVDDGNDTETQNLLAQCAAGMPGIEIVRLAKNSGKGAAFAKGLQKAEELGLTHVLQIDADGQHDFEKVKFFLDESAAHPDKVICGFPVFDKTAPRSRVNGRKISTFWAAVTTLSTEIVDALCGFRVYPVGPSLRITKVLFFDKRMGFDSEIIVRLYWDNVLPVFHPVKVIYPQDGVSNFRMIRDNLHISWVFTRLLAGMLLRLPLLVVRKIKRRKRGR